MNDEIRYHINKSIAWQSDIEASDGYNLLSKYNNYLSVLEKRIAEEKERWVVPYRNPLNDKVFLKQLDEQKEREVYIKLIALNKDEYPVQEI